MLIENRRSGYRLGESVAHAANNFRRTNAAAILLIMAALSPISAYAARDHGYIKARGGPDDAGIFINGKYVGPASRYTVPEKYDIPLGEVEIAIRDSRYEEFTTKAEVKPGKTVHIHYKLKLRELPTPPFGTLRLAGGGPHGSFGGDIGAVYVDDKYCGYVAQLSSTGSGLSLKPGTYNIHIASTEFGDIRQVITIAAGETKTLTLGSPTK